MERFRSVQILVLILILGVTAPGWAAKKTSKEDVEKFVRTYVGLAARNEVAKIPMDESFKPAIEDDSLDFAACAEDGCKPVLRFPVKIREYDEDEEDAPEEEIFEVHMDVYKSGKIHARRSGCYMVMKKEGRLMMREYQYDCTE